MNFIDDINGCGGEISVRRQNYGTNYIPSDIKPMDGVLRICGNQIEYYAGDQGCWMPFCGDKVDLEFVHLEGDVTDWVRNKMAEEEHEKQLLEKFPALQKAKDQYNTIKALVENEG